jgi:hypothetical protein
VVDRIGIAKEPLTHGAPDTGPGNLHSITLLAAFLENKNFQEVTTELPDMLRMVFDSTLYYNDPNNKVNPKENFLERLVRHQEGLDPTVPNDGDDMLTRFTSDMQKIAQTSGLADVNNDLIKAYIAFGMQAYYGNRLASNK